MPPVETLLFDLMGTVVRDPYLEAIAAGTGQPLAALRGRIDPRAWPEFEIAAIDEDEFVRRCFGPATGLAFDREAFHVARRGGYAWLDGMRELVAELAGRARRYVASNYPVWIVEVSAQFELESLFDGVHASHHLGARKPDPRFFERLLERVGARPETSLLIDDRAENCTAAEALGLRAHRFTDAADLRARLRSEGLAVALPPPGSAPPAA